jgi:hypothetical protein
MEQDDHDGLRLGPAGPTVGGQHLVAGLQLADRDGDTRREQDPGAGGEGHAAAGGRVGEVGAVFCGFSGSNPTYWESRYWPSNSKSIRTATSSC